MYFGGIKQLILRFGSLVLFQVAQRDEPIGLPPTLGLILKLALFVGLRLRRGPPVGLFQLFEQRRGLERHDDEGSLVLLIRPDSIPTIQLSIRPSETPAHAT